jgi:N,N'-diacetyllegionaminate synthase
LSTGMSSWAEIDGAVGRARRRGVDLAVLQCTTAYPCPPEKVGLNLIPVLRERYGCAVGLSDHSGTIYPGLAAAALGISVLEVHVTFSREMFGPDVKASVTTGELKQLCEGVRFIERMRACPVDKDAMAEEMAGNRRLFTKSLVAREDLAAGTILEERHVAIKKPGTGLPEERLGEVLKRRLKQSVARDALILEEQLE